MTARGANLVSASGMSIRLLAACDCPAPCLSLIGRVLRGVCLRVRTPSAVIFRTTYGYAPKNVSIRDGRRWGSRGQLTNAAMADS